MQQILLGRAQQAQQSGRLAEAADLYAQAVQGDPSNAEARLQYANALLALARFDAAVATYDAYLAQRPQSGEAWHNRGIALAETKRFALAVQSFDKALALYPQSAASWHNRGLSLSELGDYEQAARDHARAIALQPDLPDVRGDLLLARLHCCDWQRIGYERQRISELLAEGQPAIVPFGNLFITHSPAEQLQCARIWIARHVAPVPPLWKGESYDHTRIRVAYISRDFRTHPVAGLLLPLLQHHDRGRFEIFGFSIGPDDGSEMRRRIIANCEHFADARGCDDAEIARQLRQAEIDIAIDLMGITEGCRPGILACRPAPLQVGYLGYPGTMGSDFLDYIIADQVVIPERERDSYTEQVACLPGCYLPCSPDRIPPDERWSRADAGLPDRAFVFCCFNASYKILPEIFAAWMEMLRSVDDSILWLADLNPAARANLQRTAGRAGVVPERLIFAPHLPSFGEHLRRLAAADLFLDTLPFNAHATAIDALSAGIPVLTCAGGTMAGRAGASLLAALGVRELVTDSLDAYKRAAVSLARDREALVAIRERIEQGRSARCDMEAFARKIERAFSAMQLRHASGLPPRSFTLPGSDA